MPWTDWQFYVVTLASLGGLWLLARPFLRLRARENVPAAPCPGCDHCPSMEEDPEGTSGIRPPIGASLVQLGGWRSSSKSS